MARSPHAPAVIVTQLVPARLSGNSAAQYLGIAPQTLANWRALNKGPKFMRDGHTHSRVYYKLADLDACVLRVWDITVHYAQRPHAPRDPRMWPRDTILSRPAE